MKRIAICDLLVNPDNKRYIEPVGDEVNSVIAMFNVVNGKPKEEMVALALDISTNGLNPFEQPIVWFDDELGKYVVVEGNRRVICIKMMTIYKNCPDITQAIPEQAKTIFALNYNYGDEIDCVVYDELDDANAVLSKIHQDINGGVGRKQWGHQEKDKNNAEMGNKSKTYALIEFVKKYNNAEKELLRKMNSTKWTSKLERVVGFSFFKDVYNITFDNNNGVIYRDDIEHVYKMLAKLILDLITKPATGNFRLKQDFEKYVATLPSEFKTHITSDSNENTSTPVIDDSTEREIVSANKSDNDKDGCVTIPKGTDASAIISSGEKSLPPPKNKMKSQKNKSPEALGLSTEYSENERKCLNEKGLSILNELEGLDISMFPYASAALCRAILEYTLGLWASEYSMQFTSDALLAKYNAVINELQKSNVIDGKRHSALSTVANKEKFIENLNFWIHSDSLLCVRTEKLKDGWLVCRILLELYMQTRKP